MLAAQPRHTELIFPQIYYLPFNWKIYDPPSPSASTSFSSSSYLQIFLLLLFNFLLLLLPSSTSSTSSSSFNLCLYLKTTKWLQRKIKAYSDTLLVKILYFLCIGNQHFCQLTKKTFLLDLKSVYLLFLSKLYIAVNWKYMQSINSIEYLDWVSQLLFFNLFHFFFFLHLWLLLSFFFLVLSCF